MQSIKSVSFTGFNEAYSSSTLVLLKPIERDLLTLNSKNFIIIRFATDKTARFTTANCSRLKLCIVIAKL